MKSHTSTVSMFWALSAWQLNSNGTTARDFTSTKLMNETPTQRDLLFNVRHLYTVLVEIFYPTDLNLMTTTEQEGWSSVWVPCHSQLQTGQRPGLVVTRFISLNITLGMMLLYNIVFLTKLYLLAVCRKVIKHVHRYCPGKMQFFEARRDMFMLRLYILN